MVARGMEVFFMDDAHDVVDILVIHRQTGIPILRERPGDLIHGIGILHGHHVHPGGQDLLHLQVVELNGSADELALMLVQPALVLGLIHHGDELFLRDAVFRLVAQQLRQQTLPLGEEEIHRPQQGDKHPENGGGEHGEVLRILLGQALRRNFAEDQDDHGQHHGGHRGAVYRQQLGKEHRGNRGSSDVYDVVADQDGGEQPVIILLQLERQGGPLVSSVRLAFHADAVERGKGGLCGVEIG